MKSKRLYNAPRYIYKKLHKEKDYRQKKCCQYCTADFAITQILQEQPEKNTEKNRQENK